MNIVIDTNVIVSAILSTKGSPYRILNLLGNDETVNLYYCAAILAEYKRVLAYERLNISVETQVEILSTITKFGVLIEPTAGDIPMTDETDRIFYDTAKTAKAILITGNLKHYPVEPFIMLPADFIKGMDL